MRTVSFREGTVVFPGSFPKIDPTLGGSCDDWVLERKVVLGQSPPNASPDPRLFVERLGRVYPPVTLAGERRDISHEKREVWKIIDSKMP